MHVQVSNFLAAVAPSVDHDAEAVLGSLLAGKTRRKRKHFTQKRGVARIGMRERCKVLLRDDEKVNFIVLTLSPKGQSGPHVIFLSEIAKLLSNQEVRNELMYASSEDEIREVLELL